MKKLKLRKVFVLREVEIKFADLRRGDVFRFGKGSPKDTVDTNLWNIAEGEATEDKPKGNYAIQCQTVVLTPSYQEQMNRRLWSAKEEKQARLAEHFKEKK